MHNVEDVRSYRAQFREEYIEAEDDNRKLPLWNVKVLDLQQQQHQQYPTTSTTATSTTLIELESILFPKSKSMPTTMKNIYATKSITASTTTSGGTPIPLWIPSRSVTRRMEWFVSELDTANIQG
jgi:hypothetical protein